MKEKFTFKKIIIVLMLIITAATLSLIGIFMGKTITSISKLRLDDFKYNILVLALLVIVNFISSNIAFLLNFNLGKKQFVHIKNEIFKRDIKNKNNANIANYTTNIESLYSNRFMIKINAINLFLTMFFAVLSIIYINIKLLPVAIIAAALPLLTSILLGKKIQDKSIKFNEYYDFYQKYISKKIEERNEYLRYKVEDKLIEQKDEIENIHEENRKNLKVINIISNISSQTLGSLSFILIFLAGGYFAFKGEIEVGAIISLVQLMNYLVDPVIALSSLLSMYNESKPLYENIKKLMEEEIKTNKTLKLQEPINLKAKNISFSYDGKRKIIDDFSYDFVAYKKYLIKAESGKGKSTLAKILAGEINSDKGCVLINNKDIKTFDYRDYILYIDQNPTIIKDSLINNIKFYRENDKVDLDILNMDKPSYYEIEDENSLSGGEKMRVSIERSLQNPNSILIYDEPVAALDDKNSKMILDKLLSLDKMVIIISHKIDDESLAKFDEIVNI